MEPPDLSSSTLARGPAVEGAYRQGGDFAQQGLRCCMLSDGVHQFIAPTCRLKQTVRNQKPLNLSLRTQAKCFADYSIPADDEGFDEVRHGAKLHDAAVVVVVVGR